MNTRATVAATAVARDAEADLAFAQLVVFYQGVVVLVLIYLLMRKSK